MPSFVRPASIALLLASVVSPLSAQEAVPSPAPAPAAAPAVKGASSASDAEAKLAIALRSYSLVDAELDRAKAANEKLKEEKSALEAKLVAMQSAVPLAAQVEGLRDQLRQTQAQMAAYAEENLQLRNKLAMGASNSGGASALPTEPAPTPVAASAAAATTAAAHEGRRTHVIVDGDTLVKISQTYYGTPNRWADILAANRDVLRDEKSLVIGRTLVLP